MFGTPQCRKSLEHATSKCFPFYKVHQELSDSLSKGYLRRTPGDRFPQDSPNGLKGRRGGLWRFSPSEVGTATSRSLLARELEWAEGIDRGGKRGERDDRREEV